MSIYVLGWCLAILSLGINKFGRAPGAFSAYVAILFFTCVAAFRGDVGTDTANYEMWVREVRYIDFMDLGLEVGFSGLIYFLSILFDSDRVAIRVLSVLFGIFLVWIFSRSDIRTRYYLLAFYVPVFFYSYSMNAMRIGVASLLILFSFQSLLREDLYKFFIFGVGAILFHSTAVFPFAYLLMASNIFGSKQRFFAPVVISVLLVFFWIYSSSIVEDKAAAYAGYEAPDELSGLSQIGVLFVLFVGVWFARVPLLDRIKQIGVGFFFAIVFWSIARVSYAGLRFLDLLLLAFPLGVLISFKASTKNSLISFRVSLVLAGIVSAIAQARGYILSAGIGNTPFLPYVTLF